MIETEINLTEREVNALREISQRTGRLESELVREAADRFIADTRTEDRRALMQKARGISRDRQDLPTLRELRSEWDRS